MLPFARKQKNKENWLFTGDSHDPDYISYCLELARDLRVCLHLDFILGKHQISQLRSVCVKVEARRFVVCLLEEVPRLPPVGMETQGYFTVRGGRRNMGGLLKREWILADRYSTGSWPTITTLDVILGLVPRIQPRLV